MTAIPTFRVSSPTGDIAYWLLGRSPTTQIFSQQAADSHHRMIVWSTAGGMPSALYSGKNMYSLMGFRLVTGKPKRFMNWHCQPNDQPHGWAPPGSSGGNSPIALDYPGHQGVTGLSMALWSESNSNSANNPVIFTQAEMEARRGSWVWIWLYLKFGRSDTLPDGALKLWVAGEDNSPRINLTNVNTHWLEQHQVTFWQGLYWSTGIPSPGVVIEHALTRFGRTPQECFEDVPVLNHGGPRILTGGGGSGTHTQITARQHDEAAIPADIDWTGGGGPPAPPPTALAANTRQRRFGKTSPGVDRPTLTGDFKRGSKYGTNLEPDTEHADVYDFHIYLTGNDGAAGTQKVTIGIYDDDAAANGPGTKLGECSQEVELAGDAVGGWQKVTSVTPIRISGEFVWLVAASSTPSGRLAMASDASVTNGLAGNADTYEAAAPRLASPFGTIVYSDNELSICADYDVVVADTEPPDRPPIARTTAIARVAGTKTPSQNASFVAERGVLNTFTGSGATQDVTLAQNCTAGNTVILIFAARMTLTAGCAVTDSRGNAWTLDVGPVNQNNCGLLIASTRQNAGTLQAADIVTVSNGSDFGIDRYGLLEEFSGIPTSAYLDRTATAASAASTSNTTGTTTPTSLAFGVAVAAWCASGVFMPTHDPDFTDFPGWHQAYAGTPMEGIEKHLMAQYRPLTSAGAQEATVTMSGAESYQGAIAAYSAIGGGGGI